MSRLVRRSPELEAPSRQATLICHWFNGIPSNSNASGTVRSHTNTLVEGRFVTNCYNLLQMLCADQPVLKRRLYSTHMHSQKIKTLGNQQQEL